MSTPADDSTGRPSVAAVPRILVMGAINQDEVARVAKLPASGETIVTDSIEVHPGGKGANQAAAAAAAGFDVDVQMLGAVGEDEAGDRQLAALAAAGVDVSLVRRVLGTPTGRAYITVDQSGANCIVVGLGANAFVSPVNLRGARPPNVAIAQTEVGSAPIEALAQFAQSCGARLIINDGPVIDLSPTALAAADPLVVNEPEALGLLGDARAESLPSGDALDIASLLKTITGCKSVIVTLGANGCVLVDSAWARRLPAVPVRAVVDTTGAGDALVGALAAALSSGLGLDDAARHAAAAAAAAVTWRGARALVDDTTSF